MPVDIRLPLQHALKQLQAERSRIDHEISALSDALGKIGRGAPGRAASVGKRAKRVRPKMSAAQKRAVSKRMKAYWAKNDRIDRVAELKHIDCHGPLPASESSMSALTAQS